MTTTRRELLTTALTRLPPYARGKVGTIVRDQNDSVYLDMWDDYLAPA